jgi:hypothetical protein
MAGLDFTICVAESFEDMIQCLSCHKWVYEKCATGKREKKLSFFYDFALQVSKMFLNEDKYNYFLPSVYRTTTIFFVSSNAH